MFMEYENKKPTLSEALSQMFVLSGAQPNKSKELVEDILSKCKSTIDKNFAEQMCDNFGVKLEDIVDENQNYPINPAYLQNKILQNLNSIHEI